MLFSLHGIVTGNSLQCRQADGFPTPPLRSRRTVARIVPEL